MMYTDVGHLSNDCGLIVLVLTEKLVCALTQTDRFTIAVIDCFSELKQKLVRTHNNALLLHLFYGSVSTYSDKICTAWFTRV